MQVVVNLERLTQFSKSVANELAATESGELRKAFKRWALRYKAFVRSRFSTFSRGGGDWPKLHPRTIAAKKSSGILIDAGLLFGALDPTFGAGPGFILEDIPNGIRLGIGGPASYPEGTTIADVAAWHHRGAGNLPKRTIIVPPDNQTVSGMISDLQAAIDAGRS